MIHLIVARSYFFSFLGLELRVEHSERMRQNESRGRVRKDRDLQEVGDFHSESWEFNFSGGQSPFQAQLCHPIPGPEFSSLCGLPAPYSMPTKGQILGLEASTLLKRNSGDSSAQSPVTEIEPSGTLGESKSRGNEVANLLGEILSQSTVIPGLFQDPKEKSKQCLQQLQMTEV